jgi:hypothetical protein
MNLDSSSIHSYTREDIPVQTTPTKHDHTLPKHNRETSVALQKQQNFQNFHANEQKNQHIIYLFINHMYRAHMLVM